MHACVTSPLSSELGQKETKTALLSLSFFPEGCEFCDPNFYHLIIAGLECSGKIRDRTAL